MELIRICKKQKSEGDFDLDKIEKKIDRYLDKQTRRVSKDAIMCILNDILQEKYDSFFCQNIECKYYNIL